MRFLQIRCVFGWFAIVIGAIAVGPTGPSTAEDRAPTHSWNQWLGGPERSAGAEFEGEIRGLRELWRRPIGSGYAAVSVHRGAVIALGYGAKGTTATLFDAADGSVRWKQRIDKNYKGHDGSIDGPHSTPAIDEKRVYLISPYGKLVALSRQEGLEVWSRPLKKLGAKLPHYGYATSPLLDDGMLVVQVGAKGGQAALVAFDAATGQERWRVPGRESVYNSPAAVTIDGVRQIVAQNGDGVFAVRAADGRPLWRFNQETESSWTPQQAAPGILFAAVGQSRLLRPRKTGEAWTVDAGGWSSDDLGETISAIPTSGGCLLGFVRWKFTCLRTSDGERAWQGNFDGQVLQVGGQVVALDQKSGELIVGRVDVEGFDERFRLEAMPPDRLETPLAFAEGKLFLRHASEVVAFAVETSTN